MSTAAQNSILSLRPIASLEKPSEIIRQFTPNWFAATMGTGILAIALAQFPAVPALFLLGQSLWLFNLVLFTLFTLLYGARWVLHFEGARRIFDHSTMSMFLGCIPMGLATIVNGFIIFGIPLFGETAVTIAQALWWVDAVIAVACGIGVPFLMFTRHDHAIDQMTAIWLLPVVACEVTAASGGLMLPHLTDSATQLTILFSSYALWACSVPMAMSIIVILVLRMAVHKLPPASMAASSWLALGPIGTGALAMLLFAQNGPAILAANGLGAYADALGGASLLVGILLWGYGFWWLAMAGLITARYFRNPVPFNLGWWAYVFPLGVYAVTTMRLAGMFPIGILGAFGIGLTVATAAVFLIVAGRTAIGAWSGNLFNAPCLATKD